MEADTMKIIEFHYMVINSNMESLSQMNNWNFKLGHFLLSKQMLPAESGTSSATYKLTEPQSAKRSIITALLVMDMI